MKNRPWFYGVRYETGYVNCPACEAGYDTMDADEESPDGELTFYCRECGTKFYAVPHVSYEVVLEEEE